ncbi:MAG: hypothetical protein ACE5JG_10195 [Planctomycetota bacterium]
MTAAAFAAATLVLVVAGVTYFHGAFWTAGLLAIGYAVLMALLLTRLLGLWAQIVIGFFFLLVPAALLLGHAVDVRKGFSLLPTVYFIPFAFFCGGVLWAVALGALAWRTFS